MIIDCISDLHGYYPKLKGGDLLIVAGDLTARDTVKCWDKFFIWLDDQNYRKKVYIGGNHDNFLTQCYNNVDCVDISYSPECEKQYYLCDSGTEFESLKIWGSPWTKTFPGMNPHCKAFTVDTEEALKEKFDLIPDDIDIVITHSPPIYLRDCVENYIYGKNEHVGSISLGNKMKILNHKLHVFGHIHEQYGHDELERNSDKSILHIVNASYVNEYYKPVNKPIRIEL